MTTETLREELQSLKARREEIFVDVSAARAELEEKRSGLVDGTASADAVTAAQSMFTALEEAVATLDARIAAKNAEIAEAEDKAMRAAQLDDLAQIAAEGQKEFERYSKAKSSSLQALEKGATEMSEALDQIIRLRKEFTQLASGMVLEIHSGRYNLTEEEQSSRQQLLDALRERGVDFTVISIPWQGTTPTVLDAQSGTAFLGVPYVDFSGDLVLKGHAIGEAISLAFDIARSKAHPATSVHVSSAPVIVPEEQTVRW